MGRSDAHGRIIHDVVGLNDFAHADGKQMIIVALPSPDELVRKISSEKEPHLTLLYLGDPGFDQTLVDTVTGFVEHASSQISQFNLEVENRGVLGDKNADVLFFNKRWAKEIATFRAQLLQNELIAKAFLSTDQFPEWSPHLTLGYPTSPAKKLPVGYDRVYGVNFDRIALWTGDYTGPTFQLKRPEYGEVAMSQLDRGRTFLTSEGISHHGVKGMHWGVRKGETSGGGAPSRKVKKADAKFEKNANTIGTFIEVHNRAAAYANEHDIDRINNKPQYKNADFSKPSKLRDKYYDEHAKAFNEALKIAANSLGTNASGTRRYSVSVDHETGAFSVHTESVEHADDVPFKIVPKFDATGHIVSFSIQETAPVKHYGVKGMHWGVRRGNSGGSGSAPAAAKPAPKPRMSEDAKSVEKAFAKINSGGTHALSNHELQSVVNRMNLEQQYSRLMSTPDSKQSNELQRGHAAVKQMLGVGKTINDVHKFMKSPTGKAIKKGLKAAKFGVKVYTNPTGAALDLVRPKNHFTNVG